MLIFLIWFVSHERQSARNEVIIKNQEEQITIQDETIKEQKKTFQRKIINKSFSSDYNFEWLRENLCQDCKN